MRKKDQKLLLHKTRKGRHQSQVGSTKLCLTQQFNIGKTEMCLDMIFFINKKDRKILDMVEKNGFY